MDRIYLHEYTITKWNRNKMGVQQITVVISDEHEESQIFEPIEKAIEMLNDGNFDVSHKILLEGYRETDEEYRARLRN